MPSKFIETGNSFHRYHMQRIFMKTCRSTFTMINTSLIKIFSFMYDSLSEGMYKATSVRVSAICTYILSFIQIQQTV